MCSLSCLQLGGPKLKVKESEVKVVEKAGGWEDISLSHDDDDEVCGQMVG